MIAVVAFGGGCGFFYVLAGYPREVTRTEPPAGIEERAERPADPAPPLALPTTQGDFELPAEGRVLLVFYRGFW